MSPKQWFALLCFYISYLFLGASIFYQIEHSKELENRANQLKERIEINELLVKFASPEDLLIQNKILNTVTDYCGRPVTNYTLDQYQVDYEWTFFHSFWFSFIVCSTVGYGNSSPHDQPGQAFLIFYALIGLPVNGFVLTYLGEFFSETVKKIYNRYKGNEDAKTEDVAVKKFGMIGKIMMFIVPGIAFFIFLPACLFTYFEDWPYVRSVYYSFVTLTTIGFGDYVPTFQDGQARKFGTYFTVYQIFIIFWNVIGVGYFIMIIGFIAKGMQSNRIARLEHSISVNIHNTQHRIWTEVTKDVSYLRHILNEVNMMKFKPVYRNSTSEISFNALPRSSSCPELLMYRDELHKTLRKRAISENNSGSFGSSTLNLYRARSDGSLSLIDKKKTFASCDTVFRKKDLLSNVLSALGSIQTFNEDIHSCFDFNMYDKQADSPKSSFEWTWNGNNSQQIQEFMRHKARKCSIFTLFPSKSESIYRSATSNTKETLEPTTKVRNRSFISKINPFKAVEHDGKTYSETTLNNNPQVCLENLSKRRDSKISLPQSNVENVSKRRESKISLSQWNFENVELLEKTTIADLIRAIDEVEAKSNDSPKSPLLVDYEEDPRLKTETLRNRNSVVLSTNRSIRSSARSRRSSLRPVSSYTTVFTSQNMKTNQNKVDRDSRTISRRSWLYPANPPYTSIQKPIARRLRSISESVSTDQTPPQNSSTQSSAMLHRTLSLCPTPSSRNTSLQPVSPYGRSIAQIPMITVQPPNVTTRNLLWHPEFEDGSVLDLKKKARRRLSDSK